MIISLRIRATKRVEAWKSYGTGYYILYYYTRSRLASAWPMLCQDMRAKSLSDRCLEFELVLISSTRVFVTVFKPGNSTVCILWPTKEPAVGWAIKGFNKFICCGLDREWDINLNGGLAKPLERVQQNMLRLNCEGTSKDFLSIHLPWRTPLTCHLPFLFLPLFPTAQISFVWQIFPRQCTQLFV